MDIRATIDAVKLLDDKRREIYREDHASTAVTAILYRAAQRLNADVKRALTGEGE